MYLRPDEVAKVLENAGFERVYTVNEAYGYQKGGIMFMLIVNPIWAEQH